MICFRDRTFCAVSETCMHKQCSRNFNADQKARAEEWWKGCDGEPPIAMSAFTMCEHYPKEEVA